MNGKVPESYTPAAWRGTLPVGSDGRFGLSFNTADNQIIRLNLDAESGLKIVESIGEYFAAFQNNRPLLTWDEFGRLEYEILPTGEIKTANPAHIPIIRRFLDSKRDAKRLKQMCLEMGGIWDESNGQPVVLASSAL